MAPHKTKKRLFIPNERKHVDRATEFFYLYMVVVIMDMLLFIWHFMMMYKELRFDEVHHVSVGVLFATTHFVTNSIAVADIFYHLWEYTDVGSSSVFEPSRSLNCFLFSFLGAYADMVAAMYAKDEHVEYLALYWSMVGQSFVCFVLGLWIYNWGHHTARKCAQDDEDCTVGARNSQPRVAYLELR